ncbi:MAG: hypothetical protein RR272_00430 [Synergistaceae bacterium]
MFCKKKKYFFLLLALLFFFHPRFAESIEISVTTPNELETVFESTRDFYVIGTIDREGIAPSDLPVDIEVQVFLTGLARDDIFIPLRTVRSHVSSETGITDPKDIYFRYEGRAPWCNHSREELMKSPPPDLVYSHGNPDSFYDPSLKAVVTNDTFAVLVQGGATKDFDSFYNSVYKEDLKWVLYRVFVRAKSNERVLATKSFDVMFSSVPDKILSRFSPKEHFNKVQGFALPRGIRLYLDRFPGYWDLNLKTPYEIPRRWQANNMLEFKAGRAYIMVYNISSYRCATYEVELGKVAYEGYMNSDETAFYAYDIGEPFVITPDGVREGNFIPFGDNKLRITRARYGVNGDKYIPFEVSQKCDLDVYNSVAADRGVPLTFYGVVVPIQPEKNDVVQHGSTFEIKNRIEFVRYDFVDMIDGVLFSDTKNVAITRFFRNGESLYESKSIYEFEHTFDFPSTMYGKVVTVKTSGYDCYGRFVPGTENMFYLWIR